MAESSGGSSHYCVACKKRVTVRVHKLPSDESLREIWISRICQRVEVEDWQLSQSSRICANHFLPSDYTNGKDANKWRKRKSPAKQLLKDDAVPSIFTLFTPRPTKFASAEARSNLEADRNIVADEQPSNIPDEQPSNIPEEDEKESDHFTTEGRAA